MVEVRFARRGEIQALSDLAVSSFVAGNLAAAPRDQLVAHAAEAFSTARLTTQLADPTVSLIVAADGERLVGYATVCAAVLPAGAAIAARRPAQLSRLYTALGQTGRGLGTALMSGVWRAVVDGGYDVCWLEVWEGNTRAIAFYERWGFGDVGHSWAPVTPPPLLRVMAARVGAR